VCVFTPRQDVEQRKRRKKERKRIYARSWACVCVFVIEKNEAICAHAHIWNDEKKERTAHEFESPGQTHIYGGIHTHIHTSSGSVSEMWDIAAKLLINMNK
jgi:hypothetical protein